MLLRGPHAGQGGFEVAGDEEFAGATVLTWGGSGWKIPSDRGAMGREGRPEMLLVPRRGSCGGRWRLGGRGAARPRRRKALLRAEQNKAAKARVWGVCGGEM